MFITLREVAELEGVAGAQAGVKDVGVAIEKKATGDILALTECSVLRLHRRPNPGCDTAGRFCKLSPWEGPG